MGMTSYLYFAFNPVTRYAQSNQTQTPEFVVLVPGEAVPEACLETVKNWAGRPKWAATEVRKRRRGVVSSNDESTPATEVRKRRVFESSDDE